MAQLHKRFTDNQVKELIERYLKKEIKREHIQQILGIKKARFFALLKEYRSDPNNFSIQYIRTAKTRKIESSIENNIFKELEVEKKLVEDKNIPLKGYNYSYIKDRLEIEYNQKVSLPTIISRAKEGGFYLKKPKRKAHDREVLTNYAGELIQHDSSHHLFAPLAGKKWYLITSLDDYSRYILYAKLIEKETSLAHIMALQSVALKWGLPLSYYVDCHSIFRFIQGRDSLWRRHHKLTDEVTPQWKQVLDELGVKVTYALSPQAKGKIERPYSWLQDRLIRTCAREDIDKIADGQSVLNRELYRYNNCQVHSTTGEIPYIRFKRALNDKKSLFRQFELKPPLRSTKDIFCLRTNRTVDSYRKISINNMQIKVSGANPRDILMLRIYPMSNSLSEVRFWRKNELIDIQKLKSNDLEGVHF